MKGMTAAILLLCVSQASFGQKLKDDQLWQLVDALHQAVFTTKDPKVLSHMVSDRVSYGHSSGVVENKDLMVRNASANQTVYESQEIERLGSHITGKVAWVRYNFRAVTMENGKTAPLNLQILQVWKRTGKQWKLWVRQAVRIEPKRSA